MTEVVDSTSALRVRADQVTLRDATAEDAEFLAWVMLTAMRSHLERGIWEYLLDTDEAETLEYLRRLVLAGPDHMFKFSRYIVAEVDGVPAAALCGYDPATQGFEVYMPVAMQIAAEMGSTEENMNEVMKRGEVLTECFDEDPQNSWIVESVATVPAYRRRGLVDTLLTEVLRRGREGGFTTAKISILIGNEPARAAYVKKGFVSTSEKRTPAFQEAMKCPGLEHFSLAL